MKDRGNICRYTEREKEQIQSAMGTGLVLCAETTALKRQERSSWGEPEEEIGKQEYQTTTTGKKNKNI